MKRNQGIDLLRLLLMFMVVTLHTLGNGGILTAVTPHSPNYFCAWILETLCYCAVNCYAMITGYVSFDRKYRLTSLVMIWIQTILYTVAVAILSVLITGNSVSLSYFLFAFLDTGSNSLWYIPAYTGLYVFIPILNAAVSSMSPRQSKVFFVISVLTFSIIPTATTMDPFNLKEGYSALWLMYLYLIGAMIKKYNINGHIRKKHSILLYSVCIFITLISKFGISFLTKQITGEARFDDVLMKYNSPTMVFAALGLLLYFTNLNLKPPASKWISIFSPAAFGVYLIHCQPLLFHAIHGKLSAIANKSTVDMVGGVIGFSFMLYMVCIVIDLFRNYLFKICKVKQRVAAFEDQIISAN